MKKILLIFFFLCLPLVVWGEDEVMNPHTGSLDIVYNEADEINTDTANFNNNLSGTDTEVQTALETIDDLALGGDNKSLVFTIVDPNAFYDTDTELLLWPQTDAAITITSIKCTCDADPATELDWNLKFADAFIGMANATVIDVIDTTNGTTSITSGFDDATVPASKDIYVSFGADPDSNIKQVGCTIIFDYD